MMDFYSPSTGRLLSLVLLFGLCECRQIASSSQNLPSLSNDAGKQGHRPVELAWGIGDFQTPVGRLFNLTIPKDAFDGEILDIKVTEVDRPSLPDWLTFDPVARLFVGLPVDTKDVGSHYIAVTITGAQSSTVRDVFSLAVLSTPTESQCAKEAAETILTLILDVDWSPQMTMSDRVDLLTKFSNYMDIPVAQFKVSPVTGSTPSSLFDVSAIMAGPGNVKEVKFDGIKLSTIVGCDGDLSGSHNKELATFVDEAAKDGSMAKFTGIDVVGWHLTTSKPIMPSRVRRQNNFLNTPEPSPVVPTAISQGTPVVSTPFLPGTPGVNSNVGVVIPEIHPTGVLPITVSPTATLTQDGSTPPLGANPQSVELGPTPPPMPPPALIRTRKPGPPPRVGPAIADGQPLLASGGKVFEFFIPKNSFGDDELVGPVMIVEEEKVPWLRTAKAEDGTVKLIGLPLAGDSGEHDLHLEGANAAGGIQIPVKISVKAIDDNTKKSNHELGVVLDEAYEYFDVPRRVKFVDTLKSYYHDADREHIDIHSIEKGSVHVTWSNDSLLGKECDDAMIKTVTGAVQSPDDTINPTFQEYFKMAGFKVDKVMVKKLGACAEGSVAPEAQKDIYLSMIIPIAVVASLLILACCIGCFLYRKKQRGKANIEVDQQPFGRINKPVILAGEIGDNSSGKNGASKKPTVLTEERHPVPPPQYPGRSPTPGVRGQAANQYDADPSEQHPLLHMSGDARQGPPRLELVNPSNRQ